MEKKIVIKNAEDFVKKKLYGEGTGHDWWHTDRVRKLALRIGKEEHADIFIVELAALLHDIADYKFNNSDDSVGPNVAREWLESSGVESSEVLHICSIIEDMSFKGAGVRSEMKTIEGKAVQDADFLDAMGAIGIARTFATGGHLSREIYNPDIKIKKHESFEQYKKKDGTTINHFYEKLLLLKDRMNTETGKKIAHKRHEYMEDYLKRFFKEWEGKE